MLSLEALASWESAVLASIGGAHGTIEERDAQITRSGMYAEYPAIFSGYAELAEAAAEPATTLEALKRALFLAWYSLTEVPVESGIAELPESQVRHVLTLLEIAIKQERIDEELAWMLAWYRQVFGYMFDHFGGVRGLDTAIARLTPDEAPKLLRPAARFAGRGQLGVYWTAIVAG